MSPPLIGALGLLLLIILLFARMWIGVAMALVGILGIAYFRGWELAFFYSGTIPFDTIASYTMTAIPLFVLMGILVGDAGMGKDLYNMAHKWVGSIRGGLAMATIIACACIAAITGGSGTGTIIMGKMALPEMKKYGYDEKMATSAIASAGTLGILIPPSMGFILYGLLTQQSIGMLFMAGIAPGVLLTILFIGVIFIITTIRPKAGPPGPRTSFRSKLAALKGVWATLVLFLLVLGGIYGGIFTPTEAGGIGAFGALLISAATRKLSWSMFFNSLKETLVTGSMIMFLICGAMILTKFLALSELPLQLANYIGGLQISSWIIMLFIIAMYLILGMFLDIWSSVVLTMPVIYPIILALGFDPIWFGVVIVVLMEAGLVTPPVGMNVFILSAVSGISTRTIFAGIWPFVGAMALCIILMLIFPQIVLFLPNSM